MKTRALIGFWLCAILGATLQAGESRRTISLDGRWEIGEGNRSQPPPVYGHEVSVPGLIKTATPAFENAGQTNHWREAFWYRRSFRFSGPVPAIATLRLARATFGAKVIVNGGPAGEQPSAFAPGLFDVRPLLRGNHEPNELVIGVGATREAAPESLPPGLDWEALQLAPGLNGSVEIVLGHSPFFQQLRCAPSLTNRAVRLQATLTNAGPAVTNELVFTVREAKSGRVAGTAKFAALVCPAEAPLTLETNIPIDGCRFWSPEDPFLYELEARGDNDEWRTRFGLREFHVDPLTGRGQLNGKPLLLRGGNVNLSEFLVAPPRAALPWDAEWTRDLFRKFRSWNWNSVRFCLGSPPESWLRIADEAGLLCLCEYPFGTLNFASQTSPSAASLTAAKDWAQMAWNHPSALLWSDAPPHPADPQKSGRLDLSAQIRDKTWAPTQLPGDAFEARPFLYADPDAWLAAQSDAVRDQTNVVLVQISPDRQLPQAIVSNRWAQAIHQAALVEYWRLRQPYAGVFEYLELGAAALTEVSTPQMDAAIEGRRRDPFAPVGLMLDFWGGDLPGGQTNVFRVETANPLSTYWNGQVRLRVTRGGKKVLQQSQTTIIPAFSRKEFTFPCPIPKAFAHYEVEVALIAEKDQPIRSVREFDVLTPEQQDARHGLAQSKPATGSSFISEPKDSFPPEFAVDGRPETHWDTEKTDAQWLIIDLQKNQTLSRVELSWGKNGAKCYFIEVSSDAKDWRPVYATEAGTGGVETIRFAPVVARYVRWRGTQRATLEGYSLNELRVFRK